MEIPQIYIYESEREIDLKNVTNKGGKDKQIKLSEMQLPLPSHTCLKYMGQLVQSMCDSRKR